MSECEYCLRYSETIDELRAEIQRLRDVLHDIAHATPDVAETQAPWWAEMALCPHTTRTENKRRELECVECGHTENG